MSGFDDYTESPRSQHSIPNVKIPRFDNVLKMEPDLGVRWDEELIASWYRLGAVMPFFRAHAGWGTKRREPWCFSKDALEKIRVSIKLRYQLLFYIYS